MQALLFLGSRWCRYFVELGGPLQRDGALFNGDVAAGVDLQAYGTIFVYFVDAAMDTSDGNHLVAFIQVVNKRLLLLLLLSLRTDKEQPEHQDHQTQEDELKATATRLCL